MPDIKRRFVRVSQQLLAVGTVAALAAPAAGVVTLDIVAPRPESAPKAAATSTAAALVASAPVAPEVREVPLRGVEPSALDALGRGPAARRTAGRLAVLSAPEPVEGLATVGVTWSNRSHFADDEISVEVRSLDDGAWSGWQEVEYHDDHGPTPGTAEARGARPGTDPIVVGDVDRVQVRIVTDSGLAPAGATLAVVNPRATPEPVLASPAIDTAALDPAAPDASDAIALSSAVVPSEPGPAAEQEGGQDGSGEGVLAGAVGVTPKPQIFSRAQWGADERLRDSSALAYYEVHAGFVHHTVNANDYTRAQVPSLLRGIYAYHTRSRGWSDIGYNFVVDRFGRIWEGRYGGVDRPVVGAHTLGYNEYSFAMSALGNFETVRPSSAMLDAYGRLFAWKLSLHGVSASSTRQWVGSRYFPAINGHRDAGSTACPGRYLYARVGAIRELAAGYQAPFTSRTRSTDVAGSPWPDLVVRDATTRKAYVVRTGGQTNFQAGQTAATRWRRMDLIAAAHDLNSDGIPDVVARTASTKTSGLYLGTPQGTLSGPVIETSRFARADQLVGALDLTGDGKNDLVARIEGTTNLVVYPGRGNGGFRKRSRISSAWGYDLTAGAGDLDGDGDNDLVARAGRRLYLVSGPAKALEAPVRLPGRWDQYSIVAGAGDLTNDGLPDLVAKVRKTGLVHIFPGDARGGLGRALGPFRQFRGMNYLASAGSLAGGQGADLIGRNGRGKVVVFPNNEARNIEQVSDTGTVLGRTNVILNVGDWNGDGHGDIMTRVPRTGDVHLRPGDGKGGFGTPLLAARGWTSVGLLAAVGDITGDGHPDLMGQPAGMAMRIYPGDGANGFLPSYVAHSAIDSNQHTGLGLWDEDGSPDSLLRRSDGSLVLYRGNGPGGLLNPTKLGGGTSRYDWLQAVGDANGDGRTDVVARERKGGTLWLLPGTSAGFGPRMLLAAGFDAYDLSS